MSSLKSEDWDCSAALVRVRASDGEVVDYPLSRMPLEIMRSALPFRTFRWHYGQRHYSGSYWSATTAAHVIYESRLELSQLMMADFDQSVNWIVAQPFMMRSEVDGVVRRHVPDYLLLTDTSPVLVNVKPQAHLDDNKVAATFAWVRRAANSVGWRFEIASEPPPILMGNVRFLAGFRRVQSIHTPCLDALRAVEFDDIPFGDAARLGAGAGPQMRAALLHLLWRQEVHADLSEALSSRSILNPRGAP